MNTVWSITLNTILSCEAFKVNKKLLLKIKAALKENYIYLLESEKGHLIWIGWSVQWCKFWQDELVGKIRRWMQSQDNMVSLPRIM